jgi:hypothetical protein
VHPGTKSARARRADRRILSQLGGGYALDFDLDALMAIDSSCLLTLTDDCDRPVQLSCEPQIHEMERRNDDVDGR